MENETSNYDRASKIANENRCPSLGNVIAIISFPVAAIPTLVMMYWLSQHFFALYGSPTTSYRPIIWVFGFGLSFLDMIIVVPFPLLAERFGSKADGELALRCMWLIPIPGFLGLFGPLIICWITGSSFGT